MSTHTLIFSTVSGQSVAGAIWTRIKAIFRALSARRSVSALYDYDERMLKDIGLTRQDIVAALDAPMTEDPSCHLTKVAAGRSKHCRA